MTEYPAQPFVSSCEPARYTGDRANAGIRSPRCQARKIRTATSGKLPSCVHTTDKARPEAIRFYESLGFVASHEGMKRQFN